MRAVIVRKGRCAEDGYTEPYARLEDGRVMPMGWNRSGPIFEVGTEGNAEYVSVPGAGLWRFTPNASNESVPCPDCGRGRIPKHDRCDECGLSWEDLEAAAEFADRIGL